MANRPKGQMPPGIRKLKTGHQIQVYTGRVVDGKHERVFEFVPGGIGDARRRQREILSGLDKGIAPPVGKVTVAEMFDEWLAGPVKAKDRTPRTQDGYRSIVDNHLKPALGHLKVKELTPDHITDHYALARSTPRQRTGTPLSALTLMHHHRVLSQALQYAVRKGWIGKNPAARGMVDLPSTTKKEMRMLTPDELKQLLDASTESPIYPVIYVAVNTGARLGELLALRWRDVDNGKVSIVRSYVKRRGVTDFPPPKNKKGRSVRMTEGLAEFLSYYRSSRPTMAGPDDLLFSKDGRTPFDPSYISHTFQKLATKAGLSTKDNPFRFHDLRHTAISYVITVAGPKVAQEIAGHSTSGFTMDHYGHILESMLAEVAIKLGAMIPGGHTSTKKPEVARQQYQVWSEVYLG